MGRLVVDEFRTEGMEELGNAPFETDGARRTVDEPEVGVLVTLEFLLRLVLKASFNRELIETISEKAIRGEEGEGEGKREMDQRQKSDKAAAVDKKKVKVRYQNEWSEAVSARVTDVSLPRLTGKLGSRNKGEGDKLGRERSSRRAIETKGEDALEAGGTAAID